MEADHAGRLPIGPLNMEMLAAGASVAEYSEAMKVAIGHGYFTLHPSGAYVTFTQIGAEMDVRA